MVRGYFHWNDHNRVCSLDGVRRRVSQADRHRATVASRIGQLLSLRYVASGDGGVDQLPVSSALAGCEGVVGDRATGSLEISDESLRVEFVRHPASSPTGVQGSSVGWMICPSAVISALGDAVVAVW